MSHDFQNHGVHYRILRSLPKWIRLSRAGKAYWRWVVMGDYPHTQCHPEEACLFCERRGYPLVDRLYYRVERWFA